MGNEVACRIVAIGDVHLMTSTKCRLVLGDVWHVPEVLLNVISTCLLDDEGYTSIIRNDIMKFYKGSLIMAQARKTNTLYLMHAWICRSEVNMAIDTVGELWQPHSEGEEHAIWKVHRLLDWQAKQNLLMDQTTDKEENVVELVHTDVYYRLKVSCWFIVLHNLHRLL